MVKTEERPNLDALAYNIKNKKEDIIDFCESISTTHQLKLDVNIYYDSHSKISFAGHSLNNLQNKLLIRIKRFSHR